MSQGLSPAVGRETIKRFMPKQNPQRRRIRLPAEVYAELGMIGSITIAVKGRALVFACPAGAAAAVDVLRRHAAATGVPVDTGCVMPDHVPLVLGASATCDIATFEDSSRTWRSGKRGGGASRARSGRPASGTTVFAAMSDASRSWRTSGTTPCGRGLSSGGATTGFQGRACSPAGDKPPPYSEK